MRLANGGLGSAPQLPEELRLRVHAAEVRALYSHSAPAVVAHVCGALLVWALLGGEIEPTILRLWVGTALAVSAARAGLARLFARANPPAAASRRWQQRFAVGAFAAGLIWGAAPWLLFVPGQLLNQFLLTFTAAGLAAAAAGTISVYQPAFQAFLLASLVPLSARLLLEGTQVHYGLASLTTLFAALFSLIGLSLARQSHRAHAVRIEKELLVEALSETRASLEQANLALQERVRLSKRQQERAEQHLSALVQQSPYGLFTADLLGTVTAHNEVAETLLGYPAHELLGSRLNEAPWLPAEARTKLDSLLLKAANGATGSVETDVIRSNGQRFEAEMSARPFLVDDGEAAVQLTLQDITPRRDAEAARRHLEEQLRQAQKMESIGQLAGGVAHDFNNLLTVILANAEALLSRRQMHDPARAAREIREAATRAGQLTRQLLAFSRRQVLRPQVLSLNDVLQSARELLQRLIDESIEIRMRLVTPAPLVRVDRAQLQQVVFNLVTNARDAMPDGGVLTLESAYEQDRDGPSEQAAPVSLPPTAILRVADTGHGMSEGTKARLFEPFFTTKGPERGTGLGLATVHGTVQQSGGTIEVESEPGNGTTFTIRLPTVSGPRQTTSGFLSRAPAGIGVTGTVLLVEDDPTVREATAAGLRDAGHRVLPATDGVDALRVAEAFGIENVDLVITDMVMPKLGGPQLVAKLRLRRPELRVLIVSGYAGESLTRLEHLGDHVDFLAKPYSRSELTTAVDRALAPEQSVAAALPQPSEG